VVRTAEKMMLEAEYDKEYLPMQGLAEFNVATTVRA
jgi:aspartate/tyrosine/aromatic aminotransferase